MLSSQGSNNPQDMCAEKKNIYRESFVFLLRGRREQNVMGRTNCLSEASFWEAHVISTLWAARLEKLESSTMFSSRVHILRIVEPVVRHEILSEGGF